MHVCHWVYCNRLVPFTHFSIMARRRRRKLPEVCCSTLISRCEFATLGNSSTTSSRSIYRYSVYECFICVFVCVNPERKGHVVIDRAIYCTADAIRINDFSSLMGRLTSHQYHCKYVHGSQARGMHSTDLCPKRENPDDRLPSVFRV